MIIGDFNVVLTKEDKIGGQLVASPSNGDLRKIINEYGLIDVGFEGFQFTWNNKRGGLANIQERFDKGFANVEWKLLFLNTSISHLVALDSHHKSLLLQLKPSQDNLPKPFKF